MKTRLLTCTLVTTALATATVLAFGQDKGFPNRQVTLVVPIAAGGGGDGVARAIAEGLSKEIGFPVIVENKPGGNGVLAANIVAKSPPDAHTVLLGFSGVVQNAALRKDIPNVLPLLQPVGQMVSSGFSFAVSPSLNVANLQDLIKSVKASNAIIDYGTNGVGSTQHIDGQLFGKQAGIRMEHVPFKGGEVESLSAVMSGTIQAAFGSPGVFKTYQDTGKVKILAVTGAKRSPALPHVPTFAESGYANLDIVGWIGAFVSKATPDAEVARLSTALQRALLNPRVKERIAFIGFNVDFTGTDDFKRQIDSEMSRWAILGKDVKLD
ncbi:Argininosuccinate lyase [Variovorax sp. SRS16]|uniref:Bug family tripartite tricarboxylate transporter substrate binding protein n=1 Tax=Variovorax sp. SRS16 TaxID=282217 RepID=UPI001318F9BC|nr:tripartite tricarboxylate transporter substrate binding protein [Variovorax sp. SRS16]VTU13203.1 Argininosuccinate lyase [Variovorax sp. SRS16]